MTSTMELVDKFMFALLGLIIFCILAGMFSAYVSVHDNMNKRLNNFFGFIVCAIGAIVSLVMLLHYAGVPTMHITP